MDPLSLRSGIITEASDIFSLGVIASELIAGKRLGSSAEVPTGKVPEDAQELLKGLLSHDRETRWNLDQVLSCRYVRGLLKCRICLSFFPGDEMVHCSQLPFDDSRNHSACRDCFMGHLDFFLGSDFGKLQKNKGILKCPVPECAREYSEATILLWAPDRFDKYLQTRQVLQEMKIIQRVNEEAEERLKKELDRLMKMDSLEREAECIKREIVDKIMNLCCPRCGQVFIDFDGCCALTCSRCSCGFCAWCLTDCGSDAHSHVAGCAHNKMPNRQVFAREEVWKKAHEDRKKMNIESKLREIKNVGVRERVQKLLSGNGIAGIAVAAAEEIKLQ
eukprot:TRINITY_DN4964_c0_g1_i5.p1 TRINITY_DN4964_c0_g1~~TRINITY_DN4964_c0_g1_i5.p1  ORF type:complete len:333 (+),score=72.19 TRINITY_DN4964_c0_g1_i5:831-1829(+)